MLKPIGQNSDANTDRALYLYKCSLTPSSTSTTLAASDLNKTVKITTVGDASTPSTVAVTGDGDIVAGIVRTISADGKRCGVEKNGISRCYYTGDAPTVGLIYSIEGSATAGKVVLSAAAAGKRQVLIEDVDTENGEVEFQWIG